MRVGGNALLQNWLYRVRLVGFRLFFGARRAPLEVGLDKRDFFLGGGGGLGFLLVSEKVFERLRSRGRRLFALPTGFALPLRLLDRPTFFGVAGIVFGLEAKVRRRGFLAALEVGSFARPLRPLVFQRQTVPEFSLHYV